MAIKKQMKLTSISASFKKYGCGLASSIIVPKEKSLWIPSRMLAFNYQTGGGIPYGKIVEIYGEESSGKSLMAIDIAYCTQQLGGMVLWADAEHAFTADWAILNGLDLDKIILYRETAVEKISDWMADMALYYRSILKNNEPILIIVDSTAALDCLDNINSSQTDAKAEMGNRAKAIYKMFRIRNELLSDLGVASIFINQLRAKVGASKFEDPDTTPGGKALQFYASIRVGFYGSKQIKDKVHGFEDRVGRLCSIRIKKNKVAPPRPTIKGAEVYFNSDYDKKPLGFDRYFNLPDILLRLEVVTKQKGSSRYYLKDKMLANGEAAFIKLLEKDQDLRAKLLRRAKINSISATRRKIESLNGTNLFPVANLKVEKQAEEGDE